MEQYSNHTELQEMREQLTLLHRKLDRKIIVNEKMIRKIVTQKISTLDNVTRRTIILQLLAASYSLSFFRIGISTWFCCLTIVALLLAAFHTYTTHHGLQVKDVVSDDLAEIYKKTYRLKRRYADWLKIGIPLACLWFAWLIFEIRTASAIDEESRQFFIYGCIAGVIAGIVIGFYKHRKTLYTMDNILQEIDDFRQEQKA